MVSVMFGVEDAAGNVRQVSLYNYPGTAGAPLAAIDALFSVGSLGDPRTDPEDDGARR